MSDTDNTQIIAKITEILTSPEAMRIDFIFGTIKVDSAGLYTVVAALASGVVTVEIGEVSALAAAEYYSTGNHFKFPSETYGATDDEKQAILHESVHAMQDLAFGQVYPSRGTFYTYETENEAAAYVAGALYYKFATGKADDQSGEASFDEAARIAKILEDKPGGVASDEDVNRMRLFVANDPTYWFNTSLYEPTFANGPSE